MAIRFLSRGQETLRFPFSRTALGGRLQSGFCRIGPGSRDISLFARAGMESPVCPPQISSSAGWRKIQRGPCHTDSWRTKDAHFDISERNGSALDAESATELIRLCAYASASSDNQWLAIAGMDFFTVPTLTFGGSYRFFVMSLRSTTYPFTAT